MKNLFSKPSLLEFNKLQFGRFMSNVPVLKPQEVIRTLENLGFVEIR
jgi:hypothetical protein